MAFMEIFHKKLSYTAIKKRLLREATASFLWSGGFRSVLGSGYWQFFFQTRNDDEEKDDGAESGADGVGDAAWWENVANVHYGRQ